jgi:SAM-dependent methyltransferase
MDWTRRMREDWDLRAREDAERFIYTRDSADDVSDFVRSGEANYNQLVRPFVPILLGGLPARESHAVEIGCGVGRMTEWIVRDFGFVDALDISPVMIEEARRRLGHLPNVAFHAGNGRDLTPLADGLADLVFSYIVFQHIPSRDVIESYADEAARVLKPGGSFKFQLNGDQSPASHSREPDTWLGETFSEAEAAAMLARAGFSIVAAEGAGTQYFVITARKGGPPRERPYVLPGEPWAAPLLLDGFGPAVNGSWRPMGPRARVRVEGAGTRLYLGLYFWPEACHHRLTLAGHSFEVGSAGDHYFECAGEAGDIDISLEPPPAKPPAFRVLGVY